jgi:hypothetical protein
MSNTTAELLEHALPTPATSISISKDAGPGSPLSHKRKRDVDETTEVNFGNINIRVSSAQNVYRPVMMITLYRSHILDLSTTSHSYFDLYESCLALDFHFPS